MSRKFHRACRTTGLLGVWVSAALLAGAQGQPAAPVKKKTPDTAQPAPAANPGAALYPGLAPNPYALGQIPPAPVPEDPQSASSNPWRWFYGPPDPRSPFWSWMMGIPLDPNRVPGAYGNDWSPENSSYDATKNPYMPKTSSPVSLASAKYPGHEAMLQGLLTLNPRGLNIKPADIIDVKAKMGEKELSTLIQSLNANQRLYQSAGRLTSRLQDTGLLHAGDRVVGFSGGKVYAILGSR
jgi:hypothetical protein